MRIGLDARAALWYRGTGIGTYTYQLTKSLCKLNIKNDYYIFLPNDTQKNIFTNKDLNSKENYKTKSYNFWNEVNIPNILNTENINIYHVPQNGVGLPDDKRCKFVITLHDIIPIKMPETVGPSYLKIFNEEMPSIVSRCDGIITVSEFSKNDIIKAFNIPSNKVYVTPLASEDIYKPYDKCKCKNILKKLYGIDKDYILYIGGFSPRKNILGLIRAFEKLTHLYSKDVLLIIGGKKGKSYEIYNKEVEKLKLQNKVIFPGFIPLKHLPYFYSGAKLFVYPSFYEGFGLPPIEAMASGTAVIASNCTSIPEILGDSAILIDSHDVDDICNSMYNVLNNDDLRNSLISKGLKRANSFSWDKTAKETLKTYEDICDI